MLRKGNEGVTVKELSQLYYLRKRIAYLKDKIEQTRAKAEKVTSSITGMPRGGKHTDYKDELADLNSLYKRLLEKTAIEEKKLTDYIEQVEDIQLKNIMQYRFAECLTWGEVAIKIGGNNTENSVRMRVYRHLDKEKGTD